MLLLSEFVDKTWININRKTINGRYAYDKQKCPLPEYVRHQISLELTKDELYSWIFEHWHEVRSIHDGGGQPIVSRKDRHDDYRVDNLIVADYQNDAMARKKIKAIHVGTGQQRIFNSINEASRDGFNSSLIYACIQGSRKIHRGFRWALL